VGIESICGVQTGDCIEWLRIEGQVSELYDVAVLPGVTRPMALGFKSEEIERLLSIGPGCILASPRKRVNDELGLCVNLADIRVLQVHLPDLLL
jgi:hypothetical protein